MEESIPIGASSDIYVDDFEQNAVARAIGMDSFADIRKNSIQIKRLIEWAKLKGSQSIEDMQWAIRELRNRVGSPKLGESMAKHLSQYAYLEMERINLDKQLKTLENNVTNTKAGTT